jgi:small neutral amino acid transporter SnatA (MarC family)
MKMIISEIVESALFFILLVIVLYILQFFKIDFNLLYVVAGLLVLWTTAKISYKRNRSRKKLDSKK